MPFVFKACEEDDNGKAYDSKIKCPLCQLNWVKVTKICDSCREKNQLKLIKNNLALIAYLYEDEEIILLLEQVHFQYDGVDSVRKLDWQFFYQFDYLIRKITKLKKKLNLTFFPINLIICIYSIKKYKVELDDSQMDSLISTCVYYDNSKYKM